MSINNYTSPIDIKPQHYIDVIISIHIGSPDALQFNYKWEDGIKLDNIDTHIVQLR